MKIQSDNLEHESEMKMSHQNITTIPSLRLAIKVAKQVYVQAKFGTSERWVKISKLEANELLAQLFDDTKDPEFYEMYSGVFGTFNGKSLFMG